MNKNLLNILALVTSLTTALHAINSTTLLTKGDKCILILGDLHNEFSYCNHYATSICKKLHSLQLPSAISFFLELPYYKSQINGLYKGASTPIFAAMKSSRSLAIQWIDPRHLYTTSALEEIWNTYGKYSYQLISKEQFDEANQGFNSSCEMRNLNVQEYINNIYLYKEDLTKLITEVSGYYKNLPEIIQIVVSQTLADKEALEKTFKGSEKELLSSALLTYFTSDRCASKKDTISESFFWEFFKKHYQLTTQIVPDLFFLCKILIDQQMHNFSILWAGHEHTKMVVSFLKKDMGYQVEEHYTKELSALTIKNGDAHLLQTILASIDVGITSEKKREGKIEKKELKQKHADDMSSRLKKMSISEKARPCGNAVCHVTDATTQFKRCGKCKKVWYCSLVCQKADWKGGHKAVCTAA